MKKNKLLIFILFATLLPVSFISCKKEYKLETEPNNNFKTANQIEFNKKTKGYFQKKEDNDFYKLTIIKNQVLDIELSAVKGINHAIQIWKVSNSNKKLLKKVDDSRKSSPERIVNFYVEAGEYYIHVLHGDRDLAKANKQIAYNLLVTSRETEYEETEPNDIKEQATIIELGNEYSGYFSPAFNKLNKSIENRLREEDFYKINIQCEDDQPVLIDIFVSAVPGINSILYLYDDSNNLIAVSDQNGINKEESLKNIGITQTGDYYILIASKSYEKNNEIPYILKTTKQEYDTNVEMEFNDSFEKANNIVENSINAQIQSKSDKDIFKFSIDENPGYYRLEAVGVENLNLKMKIFDSKYNLLFDIDNNTDNIEIMPNIFIKEDIFILVEGSYSNIKEDLLYRVSLEQLSEVEGMELEPNNDKKEANQVKNNIITGYTSNKDDVDFYVLKYEKIQKHNFTITGIEGAELEISITDPLGYIIKTIKINSEEPVLLSEMIDGRAYIVVKSIIANYNKPYYIEIGKK